MRIDRPEMTTHPLLPASPNQWVARGFPLGDLRRISCVHVVVFETVVISKLYIGGGANLLREVPLTLDPGAHDIPLRDVPLLVYPNNLTLETAQGLLLSGLVVGMDRDHPFLDKLPEGYGGAWVNGLLTSSREGSRYAMKRFEPGLWIVTPLEDEIFHGLSVYISSFAKIEEVHVGGGANLLKEEPETLSPGWHDLKLKTPVLVRPPNKVSFTVSEGHVFAAEARFAMFASPPSGVANLHDQEAP